MKKMQWYNYVGLIGFGSLLIASLLDLIHASTANYDHHNSVIITLFIIAIICIPVSFIAQIVNRKK